jgi:uncharacterized protein YraI
MSVAKAAASAAIFILASAVGAAARPVVTAADTNLRKSPGTDAAVLTLLTKGTSIEVGKCSNGWCEASFDGQNGYVIARNVGMAAAPRPPRSPRRPAIADQIVEEDAPPVYYGPRPYAVGPLYYGYGPCCGYYGGWGGGWGWGRRW